MTRLRTWRKWTIPTVKGGDEQDAGTRCCELVSLGMPFRSRHPLYGQGIAQRLPGPCQRDLPDRPKVVAEELPHQISATSNDCGSRIAVWELRKFQSSELERDGRGRKGTQSCWKLLKTKSSRPLMRWACSSVTDIEKFGQSDRLISGFLRDRSVPGSNPGRPIQNHFSA